MGRLFFLQMHLQFEVTGINLVHGSPCVASFLKEDTAQNGNRFGWGGRLSVGFWSQTSSSSTFSMNRNLTSHRSPAIIA